MGDQSAGKELNELVSVIIPVYNTRNYLRRCLDSICNQTYGRLEILLVDDGSTDGAGALCDEFAAEDPRIRVFHKENGGSSSARNLGLENASGEFIGFIDSDDFIEPDMYELLVQAIMEYDTNVAQIGRDELDEQGNPLPDICIPPEREMLISHRDFLKELLMHRGDCSFCTKLFRREVLEGKAFPVGALNEDFHFLVELLPKLGDTVSLPKQAYHVFYRMNSNSRKADREQFSRVYEDNVRNADWVLAQVCGKMRQDRELCRIAFRFGVFQRIDYMLHIPISRMKRGNSFYQKVARRLRRDWLRGMMNPYLTAKNKCYMTLFAAAPRTVRVLHRRLRGFY